MFEDLQVAFLSQLFRVNSFRERFEGFILFEQILLQSL